MIIVSRRKLLLICSIVVLAIVYVLQLTLGGASAVRVVTVDVPIDAIEITLSSAGTIRLVRDVDAWFVSDTQNSAERKPADETVVSTLLAAISTVKTLGRVSGNPESGAFGLDTPITVSAFSSGKKVRTIIVGNTSPTMMQTYCQLDSSNDVLLVSGNLRTTFDKSEESLLAPEPSAPENSPMDESSPEAALIDEGFPLDQLGID